MSSSSDKQPNAELKLCKDCKHYKVYRLDADGLSKCKKLRKFETSAVTGKKYLIRDAYCDLSRKPMAACGPDGKLFELKITLWSKFKAMTRFHS